MCIARLASKKRKSRRSLTRAMTAASVGLVLGMVVAVTVAVTVADGGGAIAKADPSGPPAWSATTPFDKAARLRELSPMQLHVTQEDGTEPPFQNPFWNNHRQGLYVDVVSGEPLFSSRDKYDSGTGWPSFTQPIEPGHLVTKSDHSLFETRVEVRSLRADSHLGHVFDDGPPPTGKRYCMNSAALRFVPVEDMAAAGYGAYLPRFGLGPKGGERPACAGKATGTRCAMGSRP